MNRGAMENINNHTPKRHPAFGALGRNVDLGIAILVAESGAGEYEIIGPVGTINEGIEVASQDYGRRLDELDRCGEPMHVDVYRIWSRDYHGEYRVAFEIREDDNPVTTG
jgi:hypothetical protein